MLSTNDMIRRGKVYYDEIIEAKRKKDDEKRYITQRIMQRSQAIQPDGFSSTYMSVAKEESKKRRPENMEDTIRMAGLSGKVPQSAGKPKSIKPMAAKSSQVMKPGAEI